MFIDFFVVLFTSQYKLQTFCLLCFQLARVTEASTSVPPGKRPSHTGCVMKTWHKNMNCSDVIFQTKRIHTTRSTREEFVTSFPWNVVLNYNHTCKCFFLSPVKLYSVSVNLSVCPSLLKMYVFVVHRSLLDLDLNETTFLNKWLIKIWICKKVLTAHFTVVEPPASCLSQQGALLPRWEPHKASIQEAT